MIRSSKVLYPHASGLLYANSPKLGLSLSHTMGTGPHILVTIENTTSLRTEEAVGPASQPTSRQRGT